MAKSNNGGGPSKIPGTPEEQNEMRRKAKARRRSNGGIGRFASGTDILTQCQLDKRQQPQGRSSKHSECVDFRKAQVITAMSYELLLKTPADSAAGRLILKTLETFPTIKVPKDSNVSRTQLAINSAIRQLSGKDIRDQDSLEHGKRVVKRALYWAYERLTAKPEESVVA